MIAVLLLPSTKGWFLIMECMRAAALVKISGLFLFAQALGGLGVILQFYSIFLAKPFQVSLINALEGIIYVFLLIFIYILSKWNPDLLKEEMRGANFFQKILATLLIVMGLAILAFL